MLQAGSAATRGESDYAKKVVQLTAKSENTTRQQTIVANQRGTETEKEVHNKQNAVGRKGRNVI